MTVEMYKNPKTVMVLKLLENMGTRRLSRAKYNVFYIINDI